MILFLPEAVELSDTVEWLVACGALSDSTKGSYLVLSDGRPFRIETASSDADLGLSFEGSDAAVLEHCLQCRRAWYVIYKGSAGPVRSLIPHLARRWPLYVDTAFNEVLTGSAFTERLLLDPSWDMQDGFEGRRRIDNFVF